MPILHLSSLQREPRILLGSPFWLSKGLGSMEAVPEIVHQATTSCLAARCCAANVHVHEGERKSGVRAHWDVVRAPSRKQAAPTTPLLLIGRVLSLSKLTCFLSARLLATTSGSGVVACASQRITQVASENAEHCCEQQRCNQRSESARSAPFSRLFNSRALSKASAHLETDAPDSQGGSMKDLALVPSATIHGSSSKMTFHQERFNCKQHDHG